MKKNSYSVPFSSNDSRKSGDSIVSSFPYDNEDTFFFLQCKGLYDLFGHDEYYYIEYHSSLFVNEGKKAPASLEDYHMFKHEHRT